MKFFELLQIAIGRRMEFSQAPTEEEWRNLFQLAKKQAMVGIAFLGVEKLPKELRPPKAVLVSWYLQTQKIKEKNIELDKATAAVAQMFREEGFDNLILKGQGVAQLYQVREAGTHIGAYRTPGDIDVWLEGDRKTIADYVRRHVPDGDIVYHHVDFPVLENVPIEVHFTPSWMNSPVTNRRLQRFFRDEGELSAGGNNRQAALDGQMMCLSEVNRTDSLWAKEAHSHDKGLPTPTLAFNRVYILVHIYRHLFFEGIGLRQLLDYYFVLQQGFTEEERKETMRVLCSLKMKRFTEAVMWVLHEVYGLEQDYMLTAPNEVEGRFLLNEVLLAGNFGHYDERLKHTHGESAFHWGMRKVIRNFRFVRSYPSEVLWGPFFKGWQWCWRKWVWNKRTRREELAVERT